MAPRGRKPLAGRNPPPQNQTPVDFVIAGTAGDENQAKEAMVDASNSASLKTINGKSVMANEGGASLFQSIEQRLRNLEAEVAEVKDENQKLLGLRNMYVNVRERAYLTFLREHCAGYKETNKDRTKALSQSVVHGGDALTDAMMFLERRAMNEDEERHFQCLYGVNAQKIKELDSLGHKQAIRVLDAVGFARLQGTMVLKKDQETVFNEVIELIRSGKADEADKAAARFPFEANYIPLDPFGEAV